MLKKGNRGYVIYSYLSKAQKSNTIVFEYRLHDIVKRTSSDHYQFSYRFFERFFENNVGFVHIYIDFPTKANVTDVDIKSASKTSLGNLDRVSENYVNVNDKSVRGPYQLTIDIDGTNIFTFLAPPKANDIWNIYDFSGLAKYFFFLVLFLIIYIIAAVNSNLYTYVKHRNMWGKRSRSGDGPKQVNNAIDSLFSNLDSNTMDQQSEYELAIRRAFSYGADNPVSVLFCLASHDGERR